MHKAEWMEKNKNNNNQQQQKMCRREVALLITNMIFILSGTPLFLIEEDRLLHFFLLCFIGHYFYEYICCFFFEFCFKSLSCSQWERCCFFLLLKAFYATYGSETQLRSKETDNCRISSDCNVLVCMQISVYTYILH